LTPYYERGGITIYHGDALDILPQLEPVSVDAVVTDPPFKLSQEYSSAVDADNLFAVSSIWPVAALLLAVCRPGASAAIIYDNRILPLGIEAFRRTGWKYLRALTLYRRWGQASMVGGWMSTSDVVLVFTRPGARPEFHGNGAHDVYVKSGPEPSNTGHPAQKPLAFMRQIVQRITPPGGLVVDPYCGSGTTLQAAKLEERRSIGIESEERYCELVARRLDFGEAGIATFAQDVLPLDLPA
jgi:DNA modification methylase